MAFIKHGDGKIVHIVKDEDLSDEEKKSVDKLKHSTSAISVADKEQKSESEKQ